MRVVDVVLGLIAVLIVLSIGYSVGVAQREMYLDSQNWCDSKFGFGQWGYVESSPRDCGTTFGQCFVCKNLSDIPLENERWFN